MKPTIIVTQKPEQEPVPAEVIADAIVEIAKAMKAINSGRLRRSAIVALIHDRSKIGKQTIEVVLNNLESLEANYLKPK